MLMIESTRQIRSNAMMICFIQLTLSDIYDTLNSGKGGFPLPAQLAYLTASMSKMMVVTSCRIAVTRFM